MSVKAPEKELLNQHIAGLSPSKRALLELKLIDAGGQPPAKPET